MKKIPNHELAEIVIPSGSTATNFFFPDMPNLRGTQTWGIQLYSSEQIPNAPLSGNALIAASVLRTGFVTLVDDKGAELLKQMPLALFNTLKFDVSTSTNIYETNAKALTGKKINWTKSYIRFTAAPATGANTSVICSISYTQINEAVKMGCN